MNFGPKNTTVFEVNINDGSITHYKTSKMEAEIDVENSNCFLKRADAEKYALNIIAANGGGLLDVTDLPEESNITFNKKIRLKIAEAIADYYNSIGCQFSGILTFLKQLKLDNGNSFLKDNEIDSINVFCEWLVGEDIKDKRLNTKKVCRLYKEEFLNMVE